MIKEIKVIFEYRQLILALMIRGFKAKYKNSFLGIFWSLLNPLLNVLIFAFVFTVIIKIGIQRYPLFLLCSIFPWSFFQAALINSVVSIVEDAHFVKNVFFPCEVIPLAVVVVNLMNFLIDLLLLMAVVQIFGKGVNASWVYIPFLVLIQFILTSGIAVFAAGAYVIFRDINFILNLFLRIFFYCVPVIYAVKLVPEKLHYWYMLNPLAFIIDGFTGIFFYGVAPELNGLFVAAGESILIFAGCIAYFKKIKRSIPERL